MTILRNQQQSTTTKGGNVCGCHDRVRTRKQCEAKWWSGACERHVKKHSTRANCQTKNMPFLPELNNTLHAASLDEMTNKFKKEIASEIKRENFKMKPEEKKMPVLDKAGKYFAEATDAKTVVTLAKKLGDVIDQAKVTAISKQVREGDCNFGRAKMTMLNMYRSALRGSAPKKAAPKAEKRPAPKAEAQKVAPKAKPAATEAAPKPAAEPQQRIPRGA